MSDAGLEVQHGAHSVGGEQGSSQTPQGQSQEALHLLVLNLAVPRPPAPPILSSSMGLESKPQLAQESLLLSKPGVPGPTPGILQGLHQMALSVCVWGGHAPELRTAASE